MVTSPQTLTSSSSNKLIHTARMHSFQVSLCRIVNGLYFFMSVFFQLGVYMNSIPEMKPFCVNVILYSPNSAEYNCPMTTINCEERVNLTV